MQKFINLTVELYNYVYDLVLGVKVRVVLCPLSTDQSWRMTFANAGCYPGGTVVCLKYNAKSA